MKKLQNNFLKQLSKLFERELIAIIAVAIVLILVSTQSRANNQEPSDLDLYYPVDNLIIQSYKPVDVLLNDKTFINFGPDIQGLNNSTEQWTDLSKVANFGNSIFTTSPTQLTIHGVNNGVWGLYTTGIGKIYLNGIEYYFGKYQGTKGRQVIIQDNTLTIKFEVNSQIWEINSSNPGKYNYLDELEITDNYYQIPNAIHLIPSQYAMRIGYTFSPVAFVQDQIGKSINNASIIWKSNNPDIATVSQNGRVKAIHSGNTVIEAIISGTNLKSHVSVTIW